MAGGGGTSEARRINKIKEPHGRRGRREMHRAFSSFLEKQSEGPGGRREGSRQ